MFCFQRNLLINPPINLSEGLSTLEKCNLTTTANQCILYIDSSTMKINLHLICERYKMVFLFFFCFFFENLFFHHKKGYLHYRKNYQSLRYLFKVRFLLFHKESLHFYFESIKTCVKQVKVNLKIQQSKSIHHNVFSNFQI